MKIYIKDYLKKIPLIDKFCKILIEYVNEYPEDPIEGFEEYNKQNLDNNLTKFLDFVFPSVDQLKAIYGEDWREEVIDFEELRKNQIIYLSNLFNSTKGTYKALDYLTEYDLFQTFFVNNSLNKITEKKDYLSRINNYMNYKDTTTEINYTTKGIEINIKCIPGYLDRDLFCKYLENFLGDLLYFEELTINIDKMDFSINEDIKTLFSEKEYCFNYYKAEIKNETK